MSGRSSQKPQGILSVGWENPEVARILVLSIVLNNSWHRLQHTRSNSCWMQLLKRSEAGNTNVCGWRLDFLIAHAFVYMICSVLICGLLDSTLCNDRAQLTCLPLEALPSLPKLVLLTSFYHTLLFNFILPLSQPDILTVFCVFSVFLMGLSCQYIEGWILAIGFTAVSQCLEDGMASRRCSVCLGEDQTWYIWEHAKGQGSWELWVNAEMQDGSLER